MSMRRTESSPYRRRNGGLTHHRIYCAVTLSHLAFLRCSNLRLHVGTKLAAVFDDAAAELYSCAFVGDETYRKALVFAKRVYQGDRIARRLGDTHAAMRTRDEGRVPQQGDTTECHLCAGRS